MMILATKYLELGDPDQAEMWFDRSVEAKNLDSVMKSRRFKEDLWIL